MSRKILIANEKPFADEAIIKIKEIFSGAGYDIELLLSYKDKAELLKSVSTAEALIVRSDKITAEIIDAAPDLKIIVRGGAGYDNIDTAYAKEKGIVVMNTPGQNANAVAELVFGMMVSIARNNYNGKSGTELKGKKIGIHAYGQVGRNVARIAKGFGMELYAFDPFVNSSDIEKDGVKVLSSVEELYSTCNYISIHIPATEKTKKSINYDLLNSMTKGAVLVNTARKEVIDEDDLLKIMTERDDIKYVADIAPDSRAEFESRFNGRILFTPKKMGAQTLEANVNAGVAAANQIVAFFEKGDRTFQVNR